MAASLPSSGHTASITLSGAMLSDLRACPSSRLWFSSCSAKVLRSSGLNAPSLAMIWARTASAGAVTASSAVRIVFARALAASTALASAATSSAFTA